MPTTDDYGQSVSVYVNSDAPNLETLAKNLAAGIVPRTAMRFASAAARSAALTGATAPVEGMVTYLQDVNSAYLYDGSTWRLIDIRDRTSSVLTSGTTPQSAEILTGLSVTLTTRAGVNYLLGVRGMLRSTLANDRIDLLIKRGTTTAGTQVGGCVHWTKNANQPESTAGVGWDTPGAGSTTWVVTISGVGSGNVDVNASSLYPAVFTVEEQ